MLHSGSRVHDEMKVDQGCKKIFWFKITMLDSGQRNQVRIFFLVFGSHFVKGF